MPQARPEQLTGAEELMWRMGRDPMLGSSFANVMLLDRPPDEARIRARMAEVLADFPRLRSRIRDQPLSPPAWVEDPGFDLDFHLRRLALPAPATQRSLLDMTSAWAQDPFDPNRPLWQMAIVEGLRGGRAALLAKLHHAVTDGLGGLVLAAAIFDPVRHPPAGESSAGRAPPPVDPGGMAGVLDSLLGRLGPLERAARETTSLVGSAAETIARVATSPSGLEKGAVRAAGTARSLARQAIVNDSARSPLWAGRHSQGRRIEVLDLSLTKVKRVARALGATVNDVFVTAVAGGAAEYHLRHGARADELRMSMPVYLGSGAATSGSTFTPARVLVPAGIADPRERLAAVHDRLAAARAEPALGLTGRLANALTAMPDPLLGKLARQQVETVDFAASNLYGNPEEAYVSGALLLADYPVGPTMGVAFNSTIISYRSRLFMGINVDTGAVDDPGMLRETIRGSFGELFGSVAAG